jgi:hypothetical protein
MKIDPTTLAGMVAGAALAVAALPGLPTTVTAISGIIGAAAVGALGWHAKTCPPSCPGTDGLGNHVRQLPASIRKVIPVACFLALLAALAFVLLTGCTFVRASTTRSQSGTNAPPVEHTAITGWTLLDSNQALVRASAHSGYATNGVYALRPLLLLLPVETNVARLPTDH